MENKHLCTQRRSITCYTGALLLYVGLRCYNAQSIGAVCVWETKNESTPFVIKKSPPFIPPFFFDLFIIIIKIEMSDFVKIPFDFLIF